MNQLFRILVLVVGLATAALGFADTRMDKHTLHYAGEFSMAQIQAFSQSRITIRKFNDSARLGPDRSHLVNRPESPRASSFPIRTNDVPLPPTLGEGDGLFQRRIDLGIAFDGPSKTQAIDPADVSGDVSLAQIFVATNDRVALYDKAGNPGFIDQTLDSFFTPARDPASLFVSNPRVRFCRLAHRWMFIAVDTANANGAKNRIMLAISNSDTLTLSSTFRYYWFGSTDSGNKITFATLGVTNEALYVGTILSRTDNVYLGCDGYVVPRDQLLSTDQHTLSYYSTRLCDTFTEGPYCPQGVTIPNYVGDGYGYFIGVSNTSLGRLIVNRVRFSGGSLYVSPNYSVTVPTTAKPNSTVPSPGGGLDALDDRLFNATLVKGTIYCAHNFQVDVNNVATTHGGVMACRWYQIAMGSGLPVLMQSGTYRHASDTMNFWIPSITANQVGDIIVSSSRADATTTPGTSYGYLTNDTSFFQGPILGTLGNGIYTPPSGLWGAYGSTVVDPSDGMTSWTFQPYVPEAGKWGTRVQQILATPPYVTSVSPSTGLQGQTLDITITGRNFYDNKELTINYPGRFKITSSSAIVNSYQYVNSTTATANITIPYSISAGGISLEATNPDGQTFVFGFGVVAIPKQVSGSLDLKSYAGPLLPGSKFIVELRNAIDNSLVETETATIGAGNTFSFTTYLAANSYKLRIKGLNRFLATTKTISIGGNGASGLTYTLRNGDANGDNLVGTADLNIIRAAWGATSSSSNWNEAADLNGDGVVGTADLNIVRVNWGSVGDN